MSPDHDMSGMENGEGRTSTSGRNPPRAAGEGLGKNVEIQDEREQKD